MLTYAAVCCRIQVLDRPASLTCSQCLDAAVSYSGGAQCTCFADTTVPILTQAYAYTAPLHIADLQIITECLHSDWDTCDAETYRLEAHSCPPGYTLIGTQFTCSTGTKVQILTLEEHALTDYDLNPGPSRARVCVLYSRRASRLSQVRLVLSKRMRLLTLTYASADADVCKCRRCGWW
jgi:hypothetical protein